MEMLMLSITGILGLLITQIVDEIRAWLAQRAALRAPAHPLATDPSQLSATAVTLSIAA